MEDPPFPEQGPAGARADGGAPGPGGPGQRNPMGMPGGAPGASAGHGRAGGASHIGVLGDDGPEGGYATRETPLSIPTDRGAGRPRIPTILIALGVLAALVGAFVYFGSSDRDPAPAPVEYADDVKEAVPVDRAPILEGSGGAQSDQFETRPVIDANASPEVAEPGAAPDRQPGVDPRPAAERPAEQAEDGDGSPEALSTVSAFYAALGRGDGASAARLVIPSKRASGPLSAGALTRYYSSFRRPLRIRDATAVDGDTVRVTYDYVLPDGRTCQGRASVDVVGSGEETLVRSIRTQGPC